MSLRPEYRVETGLSARSFYRLAPWLQKAYDAEWDSDESDDQVLAELGNLINEFESFRQHKEAGL